MKGFYLINIALLWLLLGKFWCVNATVCEYCGKDFKSLGRHVWRCKHRVGHSSQTENEGQRNEERSSNTETSQANVNVEIGLVGECVNFKCYCGRIFSSRRSLTLHRRSCFVENNVGTLSDLFVEINSSDRAIVDEVSTGMPSPVFVSPKPSLLVGVKLPRTQSEWDRANEYFSTQLNTSRELGDLNMEIAHLNRMWAYFNDNYGQVKPRSKFNQYNTMSKSKLKKILRNLKLRCGNVEEIRYVSKLLRKKLRSQDHVRNYEEELSKDFWKFCKGEFEQAESQQPNFDESTCYDYFKNVFLEKFKIRQFNFPSWLKPFPVASIDFDLECPTYREITKIIRKMKSSGSPCPIDQISIIPFKRCPILRTQL